MSYRPCLAQGIRIGLNYFCPNPMFGDTLDTGLTILMTNLIPPPPDYTNPCCPPPLLVPALEKLDCFFQKNKKTTWPTYLLPTFFITYLHSSFIILPIFFTSPFSSVSQELVLCLCS
ncbi:hypothetical protein ACOSP7_027420 [Xanthoceras sorbifolium]